MKLQLAAALLLFPLALAMPAPEAAPEAAAMAEPVPIEETMVEAIEVEARDIRPAALGLEKRANVSCKIVNSNSDAVNCRSGPSLSSSIVAHAVVGSTYTFSCYKSGDCYEGNCTWDRTRYSGGYCYVNGYYTDSRCTAGAGLWGLYALLLIVGQVST
ncbi:hypothetical protein BDW62DRAFT_204187 [Aspergillus aurantiobrunneus]